MTHQTSNMEGIDSFNIMDDIMQIIEDELLNEEYPSLPDPKPCQDHFPQPDPELKEDVFLPVCSRLGRDTVFNSLDGYTHEDVLMSLKGKLLADVTVQHPDPQPLMITEPLTDHKSQMDRESLGDIEPQVSSESTGASSAIIGYNNQTAVPFKHPLQIQQNNQEYTQPGTSQHCSQPVYSHSSQPVPVQQYGQPVQNQLVYSPYTVQNNEPVLIPQYSQPAYNQQYTQPGPSQPVYSHSSQPVPDQQYGQPVQNQLVYSQYQPVMTQQYGQPVYSQTLQNQQYSQAGFTNQGQYVPNQFAVPPQQAPATVTTAQMPVVGPQPITLNPLVTQDMIRPIGVINGQMMYEIVTGQSVPNICTAPPTRESRPRKRRRANNDDPGYVKRPPNSFMIFKNEHRHQVMAELNIRDSKQVNIVLGQRWRMLSKEQQFEYYVKVQKARRLHEDAHPNWTPGNNHGRCKRQRTSTTPFGNGSAAQAQF